MIHNQKDNTNNNKENKEISVDMKVKPVNYFNVFDHDIYVHLAERSAKIVTALYMITDFLDIHDPLRDLIRNNITDIMQRLFMLNHSHKINRVEILSEVHTMLYATISFLEVVYRNGFVSEMNHKVITGEMKSLSTTIDAQIKKSLPYDKKVNNTTSVENFTFSHEFFGNNNNNMLPKGNLKDSSHQHQPLKDTDNNQTNLKKTSIEKSESFKKTPSLETEQTGEKPLVKKAKRTPKVNVAKEERKDNIIKILKQKRNASINDICALFKDCSSKTIQRDLNDLIDEGLVRKEGSRRWSKYNLTY